MRLDRITPPHRRGLARRVVALHAPRIARREVTLSLSNGRQFEQPLTAEVPRIREEISRSQLVYGDGIGCADIARSCGVPCIFILEYDLETQITAYTQTQGRLRRA